MTEEEAYEKIKARINDAVDEDAIKAGHPLLARPIQAGNREVTKILSELMVRMDRIEALRIDQTPRLLAEVRQMGARAAETMNTQTAETVKKWDPFATLEVSMKGVGDLPEGTGEMMRKAGENAKKVLDDIEAKAKQPEAGVPREAKCQDPRG